MSSNAPEISKLANILHQNGDKVLNALSKLSLNAVLLQQLNKEFELLIESGTNSKASFQVISSDHGNSQLLKDLHFLHDFIQKTVGLKLTNSASLSLLKSKIDISLFKNLKYLEIKKIPIKEVTGLKSVQSQLESIVCIGSISMLEELLENCGGDETSGYVWSELREAVLSFNKINKLDTSVGFAPWLQVLDLSHNQITDVKAIECLPNLKYVNLSFNCLSVMPVFNKSARKKIQVLVLSNNYIEDLSGLNELYHLTELDLSNNWISTWEGLNSLLSMSTLRWLSLGGNPISYHCNYRKNVSGFLHISASFGDFYLDKIKLSKLEKAIVGIKLCDSSASINRSNVKKFSKESLKARSLSQGNDGQEQVSNVRRSGKARLVAIPNLDDGTYEEPPTDCNKLDFMTSSTEHLITKKRIENTRSTFGIDNWLVKGSSVVQDILGLSPAEISSSYPDVCLEAVLDSVKNVVTTTAVIETHPENQGEPKVVDSSPSLNGNETVSNNIPVETPTVNTETVNVNEEVSLLNEPFIDNEKTPNSDVDMSDIDGNEIYAVLKETKTLDNEIKQEVMLLVLTDDELQEKDPYRTKIVTKWSLSSIESCVKLSPQILQFVFDTVRRDKRERTYTLEEENAKVLFRKIAETLESRTLKEMNQVVYACENCSSQFSKELNSSDQNLWCPFCNSKFILQLEEDSLPPFIEEKKGNISKNFKNAEPKTSDKRSFTGIGLFQNLLGENEDKVQKSASQSSIGSSASLDQVKELPTIPNSNIKRSDSDIEVLSNSSQSSIEVIDGPGSRHSGSTPHRKRSSEERQFVTLPPVISGNPIKSSNPAGLTESSSSGSITDSICTAYESSSAVAPVVNESEVKVLKEEPKNISSKDNVDDKTSEPIFQEVLNRARLEIANKKPVEDLVEYSYVIFSNADLPIKFYMYSQAFSDPSENLSFILRADVLPSDSFTHFPSCIVASTKRLYFLKVIGIEQGDDASKFLEKVDSLCFNLDSVKCIYTLSWYQGLGIKIQTINEKWKEYLILLRDPHRTQNFLNFLKNSDIPIVKSTNVIKETSEKPYLAVQHLLLSNASLEDSNIQYFCLFNLFSVTNDVGTKEIRSGGILINSAELLLFSGSLNWLFDDGNQPTNPEYHQKFGNLMQCKHESTVFLQFFNGVKEKEVWKLVMQTISVSEDFLQSVKNSWEKLFSVELQVSSL